MYYTGIDVHDNTSSIQHMTQDGALGLQMKLSTTGEEFTRFLDMLDDSTDITFEVGRNYWWLYNFFSQHPKVNNVQVVDARRSRKLSEELSVLQGYGRAKNDRIDAEMLAEQARRKLAKSIVVPTLEQLDQRSVVRHRLELVVERTRILNKINGHLILRGVSIKNQELFDNQESREKVFMSLTECSQLIIENYMDDVLLFSKQISKNDTVLEKILSSSLPRIKLLLTIPGLGIILSRVIHTEILDIVNFSDPKYLISYSGLAPIMDDSNGKKGVIKLNRHSNHYLKYAFVLGAHHARTHPKYRKKYDLDVKKHGKIRAKLNLARRLVKTTYWILTRQQPFKYQS